MNRKILILGVLLSLIFLFNNFCVATNGKLIDAVDQNLSLVEKYKKVGIDLKEELKKGNLYQKDGQYFINFKEPELKKDVISDLKEYYDTRVKEVSLEDALKMDALLSENEHYETIDDLKFFLNFKSLYLNNNIIGDYSALKYLKKLTGLDLDNNNLENIEFLKLVTSKLEYLTLSNNQIKILAQLSHLINLKTLSLSNNQITDLKSLLTLKKLEHLFIRNNNLTTLKGIDGLKDNLSALYVGGNPLTIKGIEPIKKLDLYRLSIDRKVFDEIVFAKYPEYLWDIEDLEFVEEDKDE